MSFLDLKEVWHYRDLLFFLTIRGIKTKYAQSVLGVGWAIIQPLVTLIVFTIVFGKVAKVTSDGVPYSLFVFLGLWPWNYFSGTLNESSNSLIANASMITKVYFPRIILPLAAIFSRLLDFIVALVVLVVLMIYYDVHPGMYVLAVPFLILHLLMTSIGLGMTFSAMAVHYRDVKYALSFATQLLMYLAPVVYSTNSVPAKFHLIYSLNPMVGVVEGIRSAFLGSPFPWHWILPGIPVSILIFIVGSLYFTSTEKKFADVV